MTNLQKRMRLYREAPPEVQDLYGSMDLANFIDQIITEYSVPKEDEVAFITIIGDVILDLNKLSQVNILLQDRLQMPTEQANELSKKIRAYLEPELSKLHRTTSPEPGPTVPPEQISAVEPLRTMEEDLAEIHGYGAGLAKPETTHQSEQSAIIDTPPDKKNPQSSQG